jgi:uncharacterized SAM-binding protein YcdF (DUF218 family)
MPIEWTSCPPDPLAWFGLRGPLLHVLLTPWLLSLLLGAMVAGLLVVLPLSLGRWSRGLIVISGVLLVNAIYSPLATEWLSGWLAFQMPAPVERIEKAPLPVAVLVGRGPKIGRATSLEAARLLKQHTVQAVYVSGDVRSTAQRVVDAGGPAERVAGDSCARTTWENATRTNTWLQVHHPGAPVLLISDPWQLPRAAHAFARQGLRVLPLAVSPRLSRHERNRLALRETAGTLLYRLLGRM